MGFRDPLDYPNTQCQRKLIAKDDPPQIEVVLLQPETPTKTQLELIRANNGGFTSKAYGPQSSSGENLKHSTVQVDSSNTPVLRKILAFINERTGVFPLKQDTAKTGGNKTFPACLSGIQST